jgi:integrase
MEDMNKEEEWLASLLKENTKLHHTKSMQYFKEFTKLSPEKMLDLRRKEGKRFNTRIVLFWKWMQNEKELSASTSSSYVFGISSFFSYYDLDLKLKGKIPDTKMKIEKYQPTLEDFQKIYRLGDLQTKTLISLMREVPARVGDLVKKVIPRVTEKEFLIESEKETIVGKVYISEQTLELYKQLQKANMSLPTTKRGIAKILEKASQIADVPKFNPHLIRKYFFTIGSNLNINRDILKVLMFKSVGKDILTYLLNRNELREAWSLVVNAIPLEQQRGNGRVNNLMDAMDLVLRVLRKMCIRELKAEGYTEGTLSILRDYSRYSYKEILEKYLEEEG